MAHRLLARLSISALLMAGLSARAQDDWVEEGEGRPAGDYDVRVDVEGAGAVTLDQFQAGLAPHGDWVQSGGFGTAWRPRVAAGWRPYYYGRWEWTNEGWLWVSEEPFGWATYHYGRWAWDAGQGWLWVPGYQWAPAWVSWRYGGDVVGWAPLAPGLSLYVTNYAFVDFWWTFVPSVRFCGSPVWGVAYPPGRAHQFYGVTRPAPPRHRQPSMGPPGGVSPRYQGGGRPVPAWGGPSPRSIEERSGRPVTASRIVPQQAPGASRGRAGEIGVYRPELNQRDAPPRQRYAPPPGAPSQPRYAPPSGAPSQPRYSPPSAPRRDGRQGHSPHGGMAPSRGSTQRGGS